MSRQGARHLLPGPRRPASVRGAAPRDQTEIQRKEETHVPGEGEVRMNAARPRRVAAGHGGSRDERRHLCLYTFYYVQ